MEDYVEKQFVVTARPDMSVQRAAEVMDQQNVGCVVVIEEETVETETGTRTRETPIGILTDRDIVVKVVQEGDDPASVRVEEIMNSDLVTVDKGAGLMKIIRRMDEGNCRRIPILHEGELVDIITMDDLLRILADGLSKLTRVIRSESSYRDLQREL